ncbi:MAG TPA: M1 family aminopeptidase [Frankiaceae bacterium]|nr:M1 family aminopeptidase [Frankiaceae bacterium]
MTRRPSAARAVAAAALCAAVACTSGDPVASPSPPSSSPPSPTASPSPSATATTVPPLTSPSPSAPPAGPPCPAAYAAPHPDRPVVELAFVVGDDLRTVRGTERVTFTPDLPVERLVFRLWSNKPFHRTPPMTVSKVVVDGRPASFTLSSAASLLSVALPRRVAPGTRIVTELTFRLVLPQSSNERWSTSGGTASFGTGFPLLAWERGRGWATEPPTTAFAEATTSEAFRLALNVTAPAGYTVLATGRPAPSPGGVTRRTAAAVRDVLVAVGKFRIARGRVGTTPVTVGVAPGLPDDPARLVRLHVDGTRALERRFGPFPYESLDVAVVPALSGGIEFPGAILLGSRQDRDATLVHEIAHEWFYGLVGNNQGRDPWLDESFATYAEALVRGTGGEYLSSSIPASGRNRVGRPMTYWESRRRDYYRSVYVQGAAALLRARAGNPAAFDRAIRCYVNASAHRVVTPADLHRALSGLPVARRTLFRFGALPRP